MLTPSSDPHHLSIHLYGHVSADPQQIADLFGAHYGQTLHTDSDLAIFLINPAGGVDKETIEKWRALDDFQIPRMLLVTNIQDQTADFDDAVLLANRVFDEVVTPYLVLHADDGLPIALIDLATLEIIDYSTNPPNRRPCDEEHRVLVAEFRAAYLSHIEIMDEGSFETGLLFPAIPIWPERNLGMDIAQSYIDLLKS